MCFFLFVGSQPMEIKEDRRHSLEFGNKLMKRAKKEYTEVTKRVRVERRQNINELIDEVIHINNNVLHASPLTAEKFVSRTNSKNSKTSPSPSPTLLGDNAAMAVSMKCSARLYGDVLRQNIPNAVPSASDLRKKKKSVKFTDFHVMGPVDVMGKDGLIETKIDKISIEKLPQKPPYFPHGQFAIVHSDPIGILERHIQFVKDNAKSADAKELSNKIVFAGDEGQGVFTFGFWICANGQSRNHFQPLFYY